MIKMLITAMLCISSLVFSFNAMAKTPVNGSVISLINMASGMCLDVPGASKVAGQALQQFTCNNTLAQQYTAKVNSDASFTFVNAGSGLCLENRAATSTSPIALVQDVCSSGATQKFSLTSLADGSFTMANMSSGLCIAVSGNSTQSSSTIQPTTCSSTAGGQLFASRSSTLIPISASSTLNSGGGFTKVVYSFLVPTGAQLTGVSGSLYLTVNSGRFTEVLYTIAQAPAAACSAPNGQQFATYGDVSAAYPGLQANLLGYILKEPQVATNRLGINQVLSVPIPVDPCVILIMDGGPALGTANFTMSSNLTLSYTTAAATSPAPYYFGLGAEYCFGQDWGCGAASASSSATFATAAQVTENSRLLNIQGDLGYSTFDGISPFGPLPVGAWTLNTDLYLLRGSCGAFSTSSITTGTTSSVFSLLPASAVYLGRVPLSGNGDSIAQTSVFPAATANLYNGDCVVSIVSHEGANGGIDAEAQIRLLLQPATLPPYTVSPPTPTPIYGLMKGTDQYLSSSQTAGTTSGYVLASQQFRMSANYSVGLVPIYQCYYGGGHFLSGDENCEDQIKSNLLGYVAGAPESGMVALYRYINAAGNHLALTETTAPTGYHLEEILGYVWPSTAEIRVVIPIYQVMSGANQTLSNSESTGATPVFDLAQSTGTNLLPIYECSYSAGPFLSAASNCEGQSVVAVLGYAGTVQGTGMKALYRYTNALGQHASNTTGTPPAGYHVEGVLGYAW